MVIVVVFGMLQPWANTRVISSVTRTYLKGDRHGGAATAKCPDAECEICGMFDCPENDPLHYHHDGCPSCETRPA